MGLGIKTTTVFQHSLLFYSPALSFFYEFAFEILLIVQKILIERQNRFRDPRIPKEKQSSGIEIRELNAFNTLSQVSHVFLAENALISSKKCRISGLLLKNKYIELNEREKQKVGEYFKNKSVERDFYSPSKYFYLNSSFYLYINNTCNLTLNKLAFMEIILFKFQNFVNL